MFLIVALLATISLGYCAPIALAAGNQPVNIYLFWTKGCPHCALEKEFLAKLAGQDKQLKIITFELIESRDHRELFQKVGDELRANVSGVPFTVVGEQYFIGWLDEASTGGVVVGNIGSPVNLPPYPRPGPGGRGGDFRRSLPPGRCQALGAQELSDPFKGCQRAGESLCSSQPPGNGLRCGRGTEGLDGEVLILFIRLLKFIEN